MAVRRRLVRADEETGQVSREEAREAFLDFEAQIACSGGVLTVVATREPTDLPLEMVTTGILFEWKDRTNAKEAPEQELRILTVDELEAIASQPADPSPPLVDQPLPPVELTAEELADPEVEALTRLRAEEPEEDVSAIPVELR